MEQNIKDQSLMIYSQITCECMIRRDKLQNLIYTLLNELKDYNNINFYDNFQNSIVLRGEKNNQGFIFQIFEINVSDSNKDQTKQYCQNNIIINQDDKDRILLDLQVSFKVIKIYEYLIYYFYQNQFENLKRIFSLEELNNDTYHLARHLKINDALQLGLDQVLNLGNYFKKCINLSSLYIDLSLCNLGTNGCLVLGQGISQCSLLHDLSLELMRAKIQQQGAKYLGNELVKCCNLYSLTLGLQENCIYSKGLSGIITGISKSQNLSKLTLYLQDNNIGDDDLSELSQSIRQFKILQDLQLHLGRNKIDENSAFQLADGILHCETLNSLTLNISGNKLVDKTLQKFGYQLSKCSNLKTLNIDFNQFKSCDQNAQQQQIYKTLLNLNIDLMSNMIEKENLQQLVVQISKCSNLLILNIDFKNNNLNSECFQIIGNSLSSLVNLTKLELNFANSIKNKNRNKIDKIGAKGFALGINNCKNLEFLKLNFCDNYIGNEGLIEIFTGISQCKNLRRIDLDVSNLYEIQQYEHNITEQTICMIGQILTDCKFVQTFKFKMLNNNLYQQPNTNQLKLFFKNLKSLDYLQTLEFVPKIQSNLKPHSKILNKSKRLVKYYIS